MSSRRILPLLVTLLIPALSTGADNNAKYNLTTVRSEQSLTARETEKLSRSEPRITSAKSTAKTSAGFEGLNCFLPYEVFLPADLPFVHRNVTTCGTGDDYNPEDMCYGQGYGGGEDFVYEVEISEEMFLQMTLDPKGTEWTYFEIRTVCFPPYGDCIGNYKNSAGTAYSTPVVKFDPGTYYIIIDTWPGPVCIPDFDFSIKRIIVDQLECPEGAVVEDEPVNAHLNDGCASQDDRRWIPIACNTIFCGVAWSNGQNRDTDWFEFTIDENSLVTWSGEAEFGLGLFILRPDYTCQSVFVLAVDATEKPNREVSCSAILTPGTYWLWAGPSNFTPTVDSCQNYIATLSCIPLTSYCEASGGCTEYISRVSVSGSLDNVSGCGSYSDFTNLAVTLAAGEIYPIAVENGNPNKDDICGAWIDWNRNFVFEASEKISFTTFSGNGPYIGNIFVPTTAQDGWYRMRVRLQRLNTPESCGTTAYGEVEDYAVAIGIANTVTVMIDPDTLHWADADIVDPEEAVVYVGTSEPFFSLENVNLNSLRINDLVPNREVIGTHPLIPGNVLGIYIDKADFVQTYGFIWDGDPYDYSVTGTEAIGGQFELTGAIAFRGHKPGDVNLSDTVDVTDIVYLINYKFLGSAAPEPIEAMGDVNADGIINVRDIIYLINYYYRGGPEPLHP